jgi:hypothetical protein
MCTGNGNCLEVALAYAMWGFSDMAYLLHRLMYIILVECEESSYQERWHRQRQSAGCSLSSQVLVIENAIFHY